jgi:hypothetical protein
MNNVFICGLAMTRFPSRREALATRQSMTSSCHPMLRRSTLLAGLELALRIVCIWSYRKAELLSIMVRIPLPPSRHDY